LPSTLFWVSSYVAGHLLAVAPQHCTKDQFYSTVSYITSNLICLA
jgi:hypothetical protein